MVGSFSGTHFLTGHLLCPVQDHIDVLGSAVTGQNLVQDIVSGSEAISNLKNTNVVTDVELPQNWKLEKVPCRKFPFILFHWSRSVFMSVSHCLGNCSF